MAVFVKYALSLERKILKESRTDELTQIGNRYSLYDYFDSVPDKTSKVLALFDIDDFKKINGTYGHVTGDYILQHVAKIATEELNDCFVCRYGGEEFVIVLEDAHGDAWQRLENFRKRIEEESFDFQEIKMRITVTIGVAKYAEGIEMEKWVDLADDKMYIGKNNGKNQVVF
jgi:diguanylate cyclase (GGDEF)-like protein